MRETPCHLPVEPITRIRLSLIGCTYPTAFSVMHRRKSPGNAAVLVTRNQGLPTTNVHPPAADSTTSVSTWCPNWWAGARFNFAFSLGTQKVEIHPWGLRIVPRARHVDLGARFVPKQFLAVVTLFPSRKKAQRAEKNCGLPTAFEGFEEATRISKTLG